MKPRTPKRTAAAETGPASWYSYYAGFSSEFVEDVISARKHRGIILDPWNGSGTTTQVAHERGHAAVGYDLNPVMVLVAKARILGPEVSPSEIVLSSRIAASRFDVSRERTAEPLNRWFTPRSAMRIRELELGIRHQLVAGTVPRFLQHSSVEAVSSLAAFFYVALFRTVRELLIPFRCSNPTWIRTRIANESRRRASDGGIVAMFQRHVKKMATARLQRRVMRQNGHANIARIRLGSSVSLGELSDSVDLILGSPPYCTRIDYTMATLPELAVLGLGDEEVRDLRREMIGTATVQEVVCVQSIWGDRCVRTLEQIAEHPGYASRSYYYKTFAQYFDSMFASIQELNRVLRPAGECIIVVQDSYYKDIHVDLAGILEEMVSHMGWLRTGSYEFPAKRNLGRINPNAVIRNAKLTEKVLLLRKPA